MPYPDKKVLLSPDAIPQMKSSPQLQKLFREQGPLLILIGLITAVFGLQFFSGGEWARPFMVVPADVVSAWEVVREGNMTRSEAAAFGTLLSSAFLHADMEHLLYNMVFLWIFAALAAELLGHARMILIFIVTAIAGSVTHTLLNPGDAIPMLGASGAVMGFEGAYLGMAMRWRLPDPHVWPMARPIPPAQLAALAVIGIVFDFMGIMDHGQSGIAYGAHIGGFLAGLILAATILGAPKVDSDRRGTD